MRWVNYKVSKLPPIIFLSNFPSSLILSLNFPPRLVLAQVEIAEREQELIKNIESIRQKMLKSTHEASQRIIELNTQLAELEVRSN